MNRAALACLAFAHKEVELIVVLPMIHELMPSFDAKGREIDYRMGISSSYSNDLSISHGDELLLRPQNRQWAVESTQIEIDIILNGH